MQLENELNNLKQMLLKMADVVLKNISDSLSSYQSLNEQIYINDDIVDNYERLISEICLTIMIKERPFAKDLRKVSGILKLVADLERIGDHAEDIMEFSLKLKENNLYQNNEQINEMGLTAIEMVRKSIESFIKEDNAIAREVIRLDDEVDKMYMLIIDDLINKDTQKNITSTFAIYTTLVVKYIERIADHAVNIAEWVIYINNGIYKDKQLIF